MRGLHHYPLQVSWGVEGSRNERRRPAEVYREPNRVCLFCNTNLLVLQYIHTLSGSRSGDTTKVRGCGGGHRSRRILRVSNRHASRLRSGGPASYFFHNEVGKKIGGEGRGEVGTSKKK